MSTPLFDEIDRRIIVATQNGLPLVPQPSQHLAEQLDLPTATLLQRLAALLARGAIRRIGVVPNHYAIGYTANGMSVWDIDDAHVDAIGERLGQLAAVTHSYRRPRHPPHWNYNLFAMVHGHSRPEVKAQVDAIAALLEAQFPGACRARDILYSSRILKKTGLRIAS